MNLDRGVGGPDSGPAADPERVETVIVGGGQAGLSVGNGRS
jgi:hypothetical protein